MAFASLKNTIYSWFTKEPLGVEHGGTGSNSVDVVSKIEELESAWDSVSQEMSKPMSKYYSTVTQTTDAVVFKTLSELATDFETSTSIVKNYNACSQNGDPTVSNNVVRAWIDKTKGLCVQSASSVPTRIGVLVVRS